MKIERLILITFLGNYLINNVVASIVALIPARSGTPPFTAQYVIFIACSVVAVAIITWWYMKKAPKGLNAGIVFGIGGFVVSIATAFISGVAGVLLQTGSLSTMLSVLPNFWPFLASWSTAVLLGYWVIPGTLVGWYLARGSAQSMPM